MLLLLSLLFVLLLLLLWLFLTLTLSKSAPGSGGGGIAVWAIYITRPQCNVNHPNTTQAHTPPASTIKERAMHTRDPRSGGAQGLDGRDNAWRIGAPGPHAHGNTVRHVVDDRRAEARGQRKLSNDPATTSTAPAHQPLGSANAETTPAGAPAAAADRTQRPDTTCKGEIVQGPREKEQPDGMSHRGIPV